MNEKDLLINSIRKLITYISSNKKHKNSIFHGLQKNDLTKILTNLNDSNSQVRISSLQLLYHLFHNDQILKQQFCIKIGVHLKAGRIVLNPKLFSLIKQSLPELVELLKSPVERYNYSSLWYINIAKHPLKIEDILFYDQIVDPEYCIIGIAIKQNSPKLSSQISSLHQEMKTSQSIKNNKPFYNHKYHTEASNNQLQVKPTSATLNIHNSFMNNNQPANTGFPYANFNHYHPLNLVKKPISVSFMGQHLYKDPHVNSSMGYSSMMKNPLNGQIGNNSSVVDPNKTSIPVKQNVKKQEYQYPTTNRQKRTISTNSYFFYK